MNSRFFTLLMRAGQNALSRGDNNIISQNHKKSIPKMENRKVFHKGTKL